jgi:hypothetical protein
MDNFNRRRENFVPLDSLEWTDEHLAPYIEADDYDIDDLHPEAQTMLDLAEKLADARREWAYPRFVAGTHHGTHAPSLSSVREPRHVISTACIQGRMGWANY